MMTLAYPHDTPTTTVELRSPQLGNHIDYDTGQIVHRSSGATVIVTTPAGRPTIETHQCAFIEVKKDTIDDLRTFLLLTRGLKIKWTDHNNVSRVGFITTTPAQFITNRDDADYEIVLDIMEDPES